jgi:hypothetical protein
VKPLQVLSILAFFCFQYWTLPMGECRGAEQNSQTYHTYVIDLTKELNTGEKLSAVSMHEMSSSPEENERLAERRAWELCRAKSFRDTVTGETKKFGLHFPTADQDILNYTEACAPSIRYKVMNGVAALSAAGSCVMGSSILNTCRYSAQYCMDVASSDALLAITLFGAASATYLAAGSEPGLYFTNLYCSQETPMDVADLPRRIQNLLVSVHDSI